MQNPSQRAIAGRLQPIIGIGCDIWGGPPPSSQLRLEYSDAVSHAGGVPVLLPAYHSEEAAGAALGALDALLLSGGNDYPPALYGEEAHSTIAAVHPRRQQGDLLLARHALSAQIPILGICGGLQLINIALGGDLIQDIPSQVSRRTMHRAEPGDPPPPGHLVRIVPGTLLSRIVGREELLVNTSHHQAARRLGRGLRISARSTEDDVVEAIELEEPAGRFLLAVQWHPERDPGDAHRALFAALIGAALGASPPDPSKPVNRKQETGN